jgi:hypothetical protein
MNNLDNSPWAAFSGLHTLSKYSDEQLEEFTNRLLDSSDLDDSYLDIIIFIQTLTKIKNNIKSRSHFKQ